MSKVIKKEVEVKEDETKVEVVETKAEVKEAEKPSFANNFLIVRTDN